MPDPQAAPPVADGQSQKGKAQRVSCPACGHLLLKIKSASPGAEFAEEIMCKSGGCRQLVVLDFKAGAITLSMAPAAS